MAGNPLKRRGISVHTLNNAKPKTKQIPWYNPEDKEETEAWNSIPENERPHLEVEYSRAKFTPQLERQMNDKIRLGLPGGMLAQMLMKVLLDWDVYHYNEDEEDTSPLVLQACDQSEEDLTFQVGEKIPLTERTLDQMVCIPAQSRIVEQITEDNRPNAKKSGSSSNTY